MKNIDAQSLNMTDLPPIVCGKSLIVIFLVFFRADLMFLELTGSIVLNC